MVLVNEQKHQDSDMHRIQAVTENSWNWVTHVRIEIPSPTALKASKVTLPEDS